MLLLPFLLKSQCFNQWHREEEEKKEKEEASSTFSGESG